MEMDFTPAQAARSWIAPAIFCALSLLFSSSAGCSLLGSHSHWYAPALYEPPIALAASDGLQAAESQYEAGRQAEAACDPACIDRYFAAASLAWPCHVAEVATTNERATELY